ncbi:DUF421 domain-containing protein [Teichococcus oryzae]|uniref:DUF421 domain-containing protein n=1 Tax=Teichococcus oryzae TaxID=1608942 RepID=A0A5B2TC47_9PROT|nr:YetF domain-containing protein [Pseudoroseomonas oryzae]KAA2211645.1 DUF421 domain-containing protein [Pseudoroseomonas oryzae]
MQLVPADWSSIFVPEGALLEHLARGTILYFGILVLMRIMPRRSGGELAAMDLVFVVLIADAAAEGMGGHTSIPDGLLLVVVFMAWNYLINILSYRLPFFEWLVSAPPLQVVRDGKLLRRNMRREFLTEEELMTYLRKDGVSGIGEVKAAYVEGDGKITATRHNRKGG